jgi:hypothetical protein
MKTQNYKPIKKQLIIVLMIMSFIAGAYAQKSTIAFKEDSNFRYLKSLVAVINNMENGYADLHSRTAEKNVANSDIFLANEKEEKIQVENWMLDEDHFLTNSSEDGLFETAKEEKLVVEDWMLDESHFLSSDKDLTKDENEVEDDMKVESWMLNPDHWVSRAD